MVTTEGPVRAKMFLGGEWVDSLSGDTFERNNPATGELFALVAKGGRDDARAAVTSANRARRAMSSLPLFERAELCHKIADLLESTPGPLARELSREHGKPYTESLDEIRGSARLFRGTAETATRLETEVIPSPDPNKRTITLRQPHGVVAIITPWNYPMGIPSYYLAACIAAGNAVVWKPSPMSSAISVRLLEAMLKAGLPEGGINLVFGGADVGEEIVSNPGTHAVGFTGSSQVGNLVAQQAGAKPVVLELGGNGPVIILDDADLDRAVRETAFGAFSNAGQICQSSERILVHERVHDAVLEGLVAEAGSIRLGDPLDETTTMGPLNNEAVAEKMDRHIADGLNKGAVVVAGGRRATGFPTSLFYQPTVMDQVPAGSLVNQEETFGPIAPLIKVEDMDEAIAVANSCTLGLVGSVYTRSLDKAFYCAERLECGVVNVNETTNYWDGRTPIGGFSGKGSGVGRLGGKHTIMAMSQIKSIVLDVRDTAIDR